jgi:hypothetical protein
MPSAGHTPAACMVLPPCEDLGRRSFLLLTGHCVRRVRSMDRSNAIRHPTRRRRSFAAFDILCGPPFEEEPVGAVDRRALVRAVTVTLKGQPYSTAKLKLVRADVKLAVATLCDVAPDSIARLLRGIVRWEATVRSLTSSRQFLNWIERQPWNPELLAVPAVQDRVTELRRTASVDDLQRITRWIGGNVGRSGPRTRVDHQAVRADVDMTRKHLERFLRTVEQAYERLIAAAPAWREELSDDVPEDEDLRRLALSEAIRRHRRIAHRLIDAGLMSTRTGATRRTDPQRLACNLVAVERGLGPEYVKKLARRPRVRSGHISGN